MNTFPLPVQFLIVMTVWLVIGIFIGAVNVRKLSAGWKYSAKYWRYEAIRQKEYNWNLAEESFVVARLNEEIVGQLAAWKDNYNWSVTAEKKLREQLLANGIEPLA